MGNFIDGLHGSARVDLAKPYQHTMILRMSIAAGSAVKRRPEELRTPGPAGQEQAHGFAPLSGQIERHLLP